MHIEVASAGSLKYQLGGIHDSAIRAAIRKFPGNLLCYGIPCQQILCANSVFGFLYLVENMFSKLPHLSIIQICIVYIGQPLIAVECFKHLWHGPLGYIYQSGIGL